MKALPSALAAFLICIQSATAAPRLVVSTPTLAPESKIDLVLDQAVVESSVVGTTTANTWLEIQPALRGKLRWKAQNIAEFVADDVPRIGATYTFAIAKNRSHLDQSPVPPGKFATLNAENFRVVSAGAPDRWAGDYQNQSAAWVLVFNDAVDPAAAAKSIAFISNSGQRVPVHATRATVDQAARHGGQGQLSWDERRNPPSTGLASDSLLPNVVRVAPVHPLPAGKGWQLTVAKGLPNNSKATQLPETVQFAVGDVEPFRISRIAAETTADQPRRIVIAFSQPLPKNLPAGFFAKNLSISPVLENPLVEASGYQIEITADNLNEQDKYSVSLKPPVVSLTGLPLDQGQTQEVVFKHLEPELSLPSDQQGQLATGARTYRVHTVNLTKLALRVKHLEDGELVRAFQGYRHYTGMGVDGKPISPTAPLPWSLVPGDTIVDKHIPLGNGIDTSKEITLRWDDLLPKGLRRAALFVDLTGTPQPGADDQGRRSAQAIVQLTDLGLAWKFNDRETLIYAFSCATGKPLANVKLQVFGENAQPLDASATTDASGLALVARPHEARHLLASLAGDRYLTAFDATLATVGLWHFPVRYAWTKPPEIARKAFLFTDRSLYRPGETVRLKGIVRQLRGNDIEAAPAAPARIVILDPTEKEIYNHPVTISQLGSFDLAYQLAPSKTGLHMIRLEYPQELAKVEQDPHDNAAEGDADDGGHDADDGSGGDGEIDWQERENILAGARFELPLQVEEFRRNAFEITQTLGEPAVAATALTANLRASYYQGQPVAAGTAKYYTRVQTCNPYPERFRDFLFGNHRQPDWRYWYAYFGYEDHNEERHNLGSASEEGEVQLGPDGTASFAVKIPKPDFPSPCDVSVATEVTDANQQTLTTTTTAHIHPAAAYVGVSRVDKLVRAGEPLALRLVAVDTDGKPFTRPLALTATLAREVNQAIKTRTRDGSTTTRNEASEEPVSTSEVTLAPEASAAEGQVLSVTPQQTGLHILTLRGTDPDGRPLATVVSFHVYGTKEYPWLYEDNMRVKLVSEKKTYQPGETARVLVLSPIEGTALVTVEREKVLRKFTTTLRADKPVIEIPLTDLDAPNVFVSVLVVKGADESARKFKEPQLRLGYCELLVDNRRDALTVAIDTPDPSYRPGQSVTLAGTVHTSAGKPAAGAEVTFYAEDEGTLAVAGYDTPQPLRFFYQPRQLGVDAGTSFQSFLAEDPENQGFDNKGFFIGGGGDMAQLEAKLRKNFDPCAAWAGALVTDANGRFTHTFTLPDALTRYRVIAVVHHDASRFGHAETSLVAKKDVMLEPKAPRFANQSDRFHPQVLVQNASEFDGTWNITYNAHAATGTPVCRALGQTTQTVTLAAGASATVVFPTLADNTGQAVLTWQATPVSLSNKELTARLATRLSDAVENRFEVLYPMPLLRQVKLAKLDQPNKKGDLSRLLDPELLAGVGEAELEFAASPLVEAGGSVEYLLHYPYGCVEQTTSSLIPWCAVEDLRAYVPALAKVPAAKVRKALQHGADRLLSMQLADGSFTYWPGSIETMDWATPYAGLGLVLAAKAGATVPAAAIDSMQQALIEKLRGLADVRSTSELENHARALWVLAMSGKPQPSYHSLMIDRIDRLTPAARALLATAVAAASNNESGRAKARDVLTSKVALKAIHDGWMPWSPDRAYELLAWNAINPDGPEATATLDRMLNDRNPYGHWRNTWVNGWSLLAMAQYARHLPAPTASIAIQLETTAGTETLHLNPESPTATRSVPLGPNLKLLATANAKAFARIRVAARPPVAPLRPVSNNGMAIDRIYDRVAANGAIEPLTEPKPGDLIRVSLRVTLPNDDTRFLVVEDLLPSIFETVNSNFKSQSAAAGVATSENDWSVSHSELRSDRAVFFLNEVPNKGTYTVTYLARCTLAGQAIAPPAKVEPMYNPENSALSASRVFVSK